MQRRRFLIVSTGLAALPAAAHHGWNSFDQSPLIYLEGTGRKVAWRNPHVEFDLELNANLRLPTDLAQRTMPAQSAPVDAPRLLVQARLPTRKDKIWQIELAPLTRMQAWQVDEIKPGTAVAVLGLTFQGRKGDAVLRAEHLWLGGKAYGLRSSPA
jgi:hypothetical protein